MKQLFILICIFSSFNLFSQNQFYIKSGVGLSSITNNMNSLSVLGGNFDVELTYDFKKPIALGLNSTTGYGFNLSNQYENTFYQQANLNLYFRIFDNRVIVGGGISALHLWNRTGIDFDINNNPTNYLTTSDLLFGINFTVNYKVGSIGKYNVHLRAFRNAYFPGNITGIGVLLGKEL